MPRDKKPSAESRQLTAKGAATRDRIVAAAAELMYTQGVERTSLDDIIEFSATGKSQLYHYFSDKEELIEQVVRAQVENVIGQQEPFLRDLDSMRGLERWRDAVVANTRSRRGAYGCQLGSLSSELADRSERARQEVAEGFSTWEARLRIGLERMQDSGELEPSANPEQLATGLLAALQGGYLLAQARRDADNLRLALDMAIAHIRSQTRPPSSRDPKPPRATDS